MKIILCAILLLNLFIIPAKLNAQIYLGANLGYKYVLGKFSTGAITLQAEADSRETFSISNRATIETGLPVQIGHSYQLYTLDGSDGMRKRGFVRYNFINFILETKYFVFDDGEHGFYIAAGAGLNVGIRNFDVNYDRSKYYVYFSEKTYSTDKKTVNYNIIVRLGPGYQYDFERLGIYVEALMSANDQEIAPTKEKLTSKGMYAANIIVGVKFLL